MINIFDFGSNWEEFSKRRVDPGRLETACESLQSLLEKKSFAGKSFLDVGCGSGLFSIAAHKLGATKVVGIDVNPRCIEISQANRNFLATGAPIEFYVASALEPEQLKRFGSFDFVYAWGSLHHTGLMWSAIRNVSRCVAPEGILILAIYNKHITSPVWKIIKWIYNQVPGLVQRFMILIFAGIIYVTKLLITRTNPLKKERGMDFWFDVIDWVGGYPYEYATSREVETTVTGGGFRLRRSVSASVPTGCNEFVFEKSSHATITSAAHIIASPRVKLSMQKMSDVAYDEGWQFKWDDMKTYGPFSRHLRRIIKKMIRPLDFNSVLDVGCGQGSFLEELQSEFPNIKPYGIDISSSAVELARKRVPGGRFCVLDITDKFLDEKCDLVVCSEVLEHVPEDTLALQNLKKMAGKYLLVSTPQGRMRKFEKQVGHVRNYAPGELVKKIESNGFKILSVVEWGFPFYSPLYRNFLDLTGSKGTTGEFGPFRKLIAQFIYMLFLLNSSKRGDEIFVLAKVNKDFRAL